MRLPSAIDDEAQVLSIPVRLRRCRRDITVLIDGADPFAKPDARLIKMLIRARRLNAVLVGSNDVPFAALAKQQGLVSTLAQNPGFSGNQGQIRRETDRLLEGNGFELPVPREWIEH